MFSDLFLQKMEALGVDAACWGAHICPAQLLAVLFLPKLGREISHGLFFGCPKASARGRQDALPAPLSTYCKRIATAFTICA